MNIQDFQNKYLAIQKSLGKKGTRNKLFFALFFIYAFVEVFIQSQNDFHVHHWIKELIHSNFLILLAIILVFWIVIIIGTKSIHYVRSKKLFALKWQFKEELFDVIKSEIPEITDYIHNQKIHPKTFYNSNLFSSDYDDYYGDDWFRGKYNGISFELCELHVFSLFKNIFHGFFIRIKIKTEDSHIKSLAREYPKNAISRISDLEKDHDVSITASRSQCNIYIAVKKAGNFFENKNKKSILQLDEDLNLLKDLVELTKHIIHKN